MKKKELIAAIAEQSELTSSQVEAALKATFDIIQRVMMEQDSVMIAGFGNFGTKIRKERKGRHPVTGKDIIIPEAITPVFKPSQQLKESVNAKEKHHAKKTSRQS